MKNEKEILEIWESKAKSVLLGRKIIGVSYMNNDEQEATGFFHKALVIQLDNGTLLYPSADDEGNDAGAIHYQKEGDDDYILPVI